MRKLNLVIVFLNLCLLGTITVQAQDFTDPGQYIGYINDAQLNISKKYLAYASAGSHGKSWRKVDKTRNEVMNSILDARVKVNGMPPYKGDKTLKTAAYDYFMIAYNVMREDFGKLVDLEEIAEQSYDNMEAYLMAKSLAEKKMEDAGKALDEKTKQFAKSNNVQLIDATGELDEKMKQANAVGDYYDKIYLIFFKSYKQELYLTEAINSGKVNAIEQNKNALASFAEEGLQKLKEAGAFTGDASLFNSCRDMLQFYKKEAGDIGPITAYFMKQESFNDLKKIMDSKPASKRTKEDIDKYNTAVKEINDAGNAYNKANTDLNNNRSRLLNDWNKTAKSFLDDHMPYFK